MKASRKPSTTRTIPPSAWKSFREYLAGRGVIPETIDNGCNYDGFLENRIDFTQRTKRSDERRNEEPKFEVMTTEHVATGYRILQEHVGMNGSP